MPHNSGLGLFRGTEFLHRTLFEHDIAHEYRLVHGADHVGPSLLPRMRDGLLFLNRVLNPIKPDAVQINYRKMISALKKNNGIED
jgi:hypothetical protein